MTEQSDLEELRGITLASYAVTVGMMRTLLEKGALTQAEVNSVLSGVLSSLERSELVAQGDVHAARSLLSALAQELGVPMKPPN